MGMSVPQFLRKRRMALPTISSTTSSDFSMTTPSSLKRVTDRMFSDRCSSHCAFWRISSRRADIVRDAAQEVGAHAVLFRLVAQLLLPLDLRGEGAHEHAHDQHDRKRQRVAVDGEIELMKRIGEQIVHAHHADRRRQYAGQIAVGKARDEHHRQNEHRRGKRIVVVIARRQQHTDADRAAHDKNENTQIAQPLRHAFARSLHKHPSLSLSLFGLRSHVQHSTMCARVRLSLQRSADFFPPS